jgi:hypothetical protein
MARRLCGKLTYANVVSTLCLFLLLGGGAAYATLSLPKNSVGSKQLKVHAVTASKVKPGTLSLADLKPGVITLPPTPYSKAESDARYLRSTVTVVKSFTLSGPPTEQTGSAYVSCPSGYQALGGGVDPSNTLYEKVSASEPTFEGQRVLFLSDGQHGPANGWFGAVTNSGAREAGPGPKRVAVICAPIG